jgi:site-specific DNA-methyltransferase (adenine-specific)
LLFQNVKTWRTTPHKIQILRGWPKLIELPTEAEPVRIIQGDCLQVLRELPDGCVDAVVTDPPYGVDKAEWDERFPTEWYAEARRVCSGTIFTMPGNSALPDCLRMVGSDYRDVFVLWLVNGMTLGPITFGNWIPVVVSQKERKHLGGQNHLRVVVRSGDEKIDHPSPKPLEAMRKLIREHTKPNDLILDCFGGSGTTARACVIEGRRCIIIEKESAYCDIIRHRVAEAMGTGLLAGIS